MFALDLRALTLIAACSSVLVVIGLRLLERVSDDRALVRTWTVAAALWFTGFVLVGLRDLIPVLASVVLGNTLIGVGAAWLYFGLRLTLQLPRGPRWDLVIGALAFAGLLAGSYPETRLWLRVAAVSAATFAMSTAGTVVIVRTRRVWLAEMRRLPWLLGGAMTLASVLQGTRMAHALFARDQVTPDNVGSTLQVTLIGVVVLNAVLTVAVMAMITSRMQQRAERHREELEQRVQERTAQLRLALEASEAANTAKSAFLANVSHEIRTPLNTIIGTAFLLQRDNPPPKQAERVRRIADAGRSLLDMVNAVLDLARLQSRDLTLRVEPFDLQHTVDEAVALRAAAASAKGLRMNVTVGSPPGATVGDAQRLLQALGHYLDNAVKFTQTGGITVRATASERPDRQLLLRFEVEDTGIGIAPDALPQLFSPFAQADGSSTRHFEGNGLGLALVRQLAECMGGQAGVDSVVGQGSRFWFTAVCGKGAAAVDAVPAAPVAKPAATLG